MNVKMESREQMLVSYTPRHSIFAARPEIVAVTSFPDDST